MLLYLAQKALLMWLRLRTLRWENYPKQFSRWAHCKHMGPESRDYPINWMCISQNSYVLILNVVVLGKRVFKRWQVMGMEPSCMGLVPLQTRPQRASTILYFTWGHSKKTDVSEPGSTASLTPWSQTSQPLEQGEIIFYKPHSLRYFAIAARTD